MEQDRARQLLDAERARLSELLRNESEVLDEAQGHGRPDLAANDVDVADSAAQTEQREREHSIVGSLEAALAEVDAAFARLEDGTYGICEETGEPIPDERLEAMPAARYTVAHQARIEHEAAADRQAGLRRPGA